jgi:hypothetical protein
LPERSIYHCKTGIHSRKTVLITADASSPSPQNNTDSQNQAPVKPTRRIIRPVARPREQGSGLFQASSFFAAFCDFDVP